jgi:hypothetical protein
MQWALVDIAESRNPDDQLIELNKWYTMTCQLESSDIPFEYQGRYYYSLGGSVTLDTRAGAVTRRFWR